MGRVIAVGMTELVFLILPLFILGLVMATIMRGAEQVPQSRGPARPARKTSGPLDPASRTIRRTEARMEQLDVQHEREDCTFSYSTQDPNFSFNGRQVVDELAELRRRNEAHERHLLERVHRD